VRLPGTHQDKRRRGSCAKGRSHSHRKVGPAKRVQVSKSRERRLAQAKRQRMAEVES